MRTSSLTFHFASHGDTTVCRPIGRLDLSTVAAVRQALLKAAADNPAALVVDVNHLELPSPAFLSIFLVVAERIGQWPGIPLVLVSEDLGRLRGMLPHVVHVATTLADALRATRTRVPWQYRSIHLPPHPTSVIRARIFATDACLTWCLAPALEVANTIVAALTTNAVRHARTDLWLRVTYHDGQLRVSVRDRCVDAPRLLPGRGGLATVAELASYWGTTPTANGKTVWALLLDPPT